MDKRSAQVMEMDAEKKGRKQMMEAEEERIQQMLVDFPSDEEIFEQKTFILNAALPKKTLWERLRRSYVGPGLKYIFYHCGNAWLILFLVYLCLCGICYDIRGNTELQMGVSFFAFPLCCLMFWMVSCLVDEQEEVVEIKNSMHFSVAHMVSLRMLYSSMVFILCDLFLLVVVDGYQGQQMWKMVFGGISSMFLFAGISLYMYQKLGRSLCMGVLILLWSVGSVALVRIQNGFVKLALEVLPLTVHIGVSLCLLIGFIFYIRKVEKKNAYSFACL